MSRRFLVVSARMGAGHDAVATELGRRLRGHGHQVLRTDVLDLLPPGVGPALLSGYRAGIRHQPWTYQAVYAMFFRPSRGAGPRPGSSPLAALAAGRLLELVAEQRPDAVVSVFHLAAQLTGRLRQQARLTVPSVVVVTDFTVHRQWLHPGNDAHLCVCAPAAAEVRRSTGRPTAAPGPTVPPAFQFPAAGTTGWGRRLGQAGAGRPPVLLSAGAWGTGTQLLDTAELVSRAGYLPVALCGHDEQLRRRLARVSGVYALGWLDDLPELMAACRVLVDNAAGQTAMQALAAGLPVVGYRPIAGHGTEGVRRMAELGLAAFPDGSRALLRAIDGLATPGAARQRAIATGRALFTADAAELIVTAAEGRTARAAPFRLPG